MIINSPQHNVPKLRFPEFIDQWRESQLSNLIDNYGGTALEEFASNKGSHNFISIGNYSTDGVYIDNGQRILLNSKTKLKLLEKNDLVMVLNDKTVVGDLIGSTILIDQDNKYIYNQRSERLVPKTNVSAKYLWYFLNSPKFRKLLFSISQGGTQIYVNFPSVKRLPAIITGKKEQQKIANFLTAVDDKISALDKKVIALKQYKKGVMQKIFSQQIRFKDENGNFYPDWKENRLGKISDVRDGTHESPTYIDNGYPLITSKNLLKNGKLDFTNVDYISEIDYKNINKRSGVGIGDILFGMIGTIGNPVRIQSEGFSIKNVALIKESGELKNEFLIQYFDSAFIANQFHTNNSGGTQKFLSLGVIRNLFINVPNNYEQQKIANFLTAIDQKITAEESKLKTAKEWKKGLLQRMFV